MRTVTGGLMLLILAGCGVDETEYIPEFANLYCERTLECAPEDELVFNGFATMDDCLALVGPEVESDVGRCDFNKKKAKECIKAFKQLSTCWPDDSTLDDSLPAECSEVLTNCALTGTEPTTTPTTGTQTNTGGTGA